MELIPKDVPLLQGFSSDVGIAWARYFELGLVIQDRVAGHRRKQAGITQGSKILGALALTTSETFVEAAGLEPSHVF